jgi:hypothetical protein
MLHPASHVSFAGLPNMRERTLTVNGFSKVMGQTLPERKACCGRVLGTLPVDADQEPSIVLQRESTRGQ